MSLNHQLLYRTNSIVLPSKPVLRLKPTKELRVLIQSGPLTMVEVRTVKGKIAYKFQIRSKKYAYPKDLAKLARRLFLITHPQYLEQHRKRAQKSRDKDRQKYNRNMQEYRTQNRERINQQQRDRRAKQKAILQI